MPACAQRAAHVQDVLTVGCVNVQAGGYPAPNPQGYGTTGISSWAYPSSLPAHSVILYLRPDCMGGVFSTGDLSNLSGNYCFNDHSGPLQAGIQQGYNFNITTGVGQALSGHTEAFMVVPSLP